MHLFNLVTLYPLEIIFLSFTLFFSHPPLLLLFTFIHLPTHVLILLHDIILLSYPLYPSGHELFRVEVHPRVEFKIEAVDNSLSDISYFSYEELDAKHVAVKLAHSLEDLVDRVSYWCLCCCCCYCCTWHCICLSPFCHLFTL